MNSNTNSSGVKSSKVLKQEVLTQLDKIDTDIDEMQTRLTPGQMIDDVIFYPRGGSPAATFDMLKANPVGATFLTLGTLLLMEDQNHYTYEQLARARVSGVVDRTKVSARDAVASAHDRMDAVKGGISSVKERISSKKDDARNMVSSLKSSVTTAKNRVTAKITGESSADSIIAKDGTSSDFDGLTEADRLKAIADAKAAYGKESSLKNTLSDKVAGMKDSLSGIQDNLTDKVSGLVGSSDESNFSMDQGGIKDSISGKFADVKDSVTGVASNLGDKISGVSDTIGTSFAGASEGLPSMDDVKGKVSELVGDGVQAVKGIDPLTYVAIGAGLGTLTGLGLPIPDAERQMVDSLDDKIGSFTQELQSALNESAEILKDLVVSDFKNISVNVFKR